MESPANVMMACMILIVMGMAAWVVYLAYKADKSREKNANEDPEVNSH